jgi:hypothetical protein
LKALREGAVAGRMRDRQHVLPSAQEGVDAGRVELRAAVPDDLVAGG